MKVLVTGGAGFIGSHTVDLLLKRGYDVRILDSLEPPVHPHGKKPDYVPDDAEFVRGDVRNREDLARVLEGVDYVFHLAAYQGYLPDFSKFAFTNDGSTALVYEIIVANRLPVKKVIVASSQAVYGEGKYRCVRHTTKYPSPRSLEQLVRGEWEVKCPVCLEPMQPFRTTETRVNPHNQYAVSKYSQELYALTLGRRFGISTVALRYSITQGARQSFHNAYSGILRIFATRLISNKAPVVYEDGQQLRDYVYVGDVAAANVLVMEKDAADYQVYNVGGIDVLSVWDYAKLVLKVMGKEFEPEIPGQFRFGDVRHIISDISRLRKLGWEPQTPINEVVKEYVDWAANQPEVSDYFTEAQEVMRGAGVIRAVS